VGLDVHLLGVPRIERDGSPTRLAGRKPWGLLAYLAIEPRPTRTALIDLLFGEADDPSGAARWALHQVRRASGPELEVVDEDGVLRLVAHDARIDVVELLSADATPDEVDELFDGELLQGMAFDDSADFEQWLVLERGRLSSAAVASIWSAASSIAAKEPDHALQLLQRGLRSDPFNVGANELAVDILVRQGNTAAAQAYADALEARWSDELGGSMPATIRRPLRRERLTPGLPDHRAAIRSMLDTARARGDAGDHRGALETGRRAHELSQAAEDPALQLAAIQPLVEVLVHTVNGLDEESKGLIQIGLRLATEIGDEAALAHLYREAGYIEVLEANYGGGEVSLQRALVHARAAGDPVAKAKIQTYLSISASDRGAYEEAEAHVRSAVEILSAADEDAWTAYAHASLARILLLIGKVPEAAEAGEVGIELARRARALTILPWAMVQTGEAFRFLDRRDDAETLFTEAFTMSDAIDDPCWEALSLRGLAMLRRDAGDVPGAIELLEDGLARSQRLPDVYAWARAAILVELVELEEGTVPDHMTAARSLATAGPMPDLQARLLAIAVPQTPVQTTAR